MMRAFLFGVAAGVAAVGGAVALPLEAARTAAKDWAKTVAPTPEGGFRQGNPNAPVKLVEYGSLTCPHCAHFAADAKAPLAGLVKSGRVSFEYRTMVLNGIDMTATLLARCGGAPKFFPLIDRFFATQSDWASKVSGLPETEKEAIRTLPEDQRLGRLADVGGMTQIAAQGGVTEAQGKKCLADPAAMKQLAAMHEGAVKLGIEGTPSFLVNGKLVPARDWGSLEPLLKPGG